MSYLAKTPEGLLPCPHCGVEAEARDGSSTTPYISCKSCGCRTGSSRNVDRLTEAWNRRAELTCHMVRDNLTDTTYCDVCGERFDQPWYLGAKPHGVDILVYHVEYRDARYCPHCGARVVSD